MPDIVFMGTPEFAVPSLKALLEAGFNVPLLVCQPDRKKGRGHKVQFPPTKELALKHNIEVYQPESIRSSEATAKLSALNVDFFVVIAYGKILPLETLNIPGKACINTHGSLLPKWRGAAPIQFSLLDGDEETGVCTMMMDEGMDTGDILLTRKTGIDENEKVDALSDRLAGMGAELIVETINRFDELVPVKQDHEKATYTRLLKKEDRFIDWSQEARKVYCHFRAMSPAPGVVTFFREKRLLLKSIEYKNESADISSNPGEIVRIEKDRFSIACGSGIVDVISCQPENKKQLFAKDFINGFQLKTGEVFRGNTNH